MKNSILMLISIISIGFLAAFTNQKIIISKNDKAQVMVLASYHMNNPGLDVHNMEADDVLVPKRQAEIQALVAALAKFKPTKIAIERPINSRSDTIKQTRFQQYVANEYTLKKGEDEQVGFRLAKQMGHKKVYCVDDHGIGFPYNEVIEYATKNDQLAVLERGDTFVKNFVKEESEKLHKLTIRQFLKDMNQPASLKKSHGFYMDFCKVGKGTDYPGADLVADWYHRNIRIFSNINKITTSKEDRILVIFGAGHAPILRELIEYAEDYELVEAVDYL